MHSKMNRMIFGETRMIPRSIRMIFGETRMILRFLGSESCTTHPHFLIK